jgi:ribosomal protein L17
MDEREADLIIGVGAQGTATLAIMRQLLGTLIKRKVLQRVEVVATLELAAEAVERQTDEFGGRYVQSTAGYIREMATEFRGDAWNPPTEH